MVTNNALRQRRSDIDIQVQDASAVNAQRIAPSDQKLDAKRLKLAELQVGLAFFAFVLIGANDGAFGVLIPYVIVLTAVMVCLWQALQVRPHIPHIPHLSLEESG
jgi:fatty acid desaturase